MMINGAHVHLLINMLPPQATLAAVVLLLVGIIRRSIPVQRTGLLFLVIGSLLTIPVYRAGKAAIMVVANRPGIALERIGDHHDAAIASVWALAIAGAVALSGLLAFRRKPRLPTWYLALAVASAIAAMVFIFRTAHMGGRISHSEMEASFDPESGTVRP